MVTIDVNEGSAEEVANVLTTTITDAAARVSPCPGTTSCPDFVPEELAYVDRGLTTTQVLRFIDLR